MKKLLLSLLLLLPFAAAKADIINTYTFNFTGGNYFVSWNEDYTSGTQVVYDDSLTGSGTYVYNTTTKTAAYLSLTVNGVYGSGTYGLTDIDFYGSGGAYLLNGIGFANYPDPWKSYSNIRFGDDLGGWKSTSFNYNLTTSTSGVAPVPEPSSWVLGLGGLMGMTVLASRKKKTATLKAPALLA